MGFPANIDAQEFDRSYRLKPELWREPFLALWQQHGPDPGLASTFQPFSDGTNLIAALGPDWIMKVFPPELHHQWVCEWRVMQHLDGRLALPIPRFYKAGEEKGWTFIIMSRLPGVTLEKVWPRLADADKTSVLHDIGRIMARVHTVPPGDLSDLPPSWKDFLPAQMQGCRDRHERLGMPSWFVETVDAFVQAHRELIPMDFQPVILTGEYTPFNLLVADANHVTDISGMIDFGDAMIGYHEYDLLGPLLFSCEGRAEFVAALLNGYGYRPEQQNRELRRRLFLLQILHRYSDFKAQMRVPGWERRARNLEDLEELIWPLTDPLG
jgi:hygromycin-B 7''-O-kinase